MDHLQWYAAGGDRSLAACLEDAEHFDHPFAAFGRYGSLAAECRVRGVLCIDIVVFSTPVAILPIGCGDLEDFDAGLLHAAKQAGTIGARALDADALERAERSHPGEHLFVALPGRRNALTAKNTVMIVYDGSDLQILVGVDATRDLLFGG